MTALWEILGGEGYSVVHLGGSESTAVFAIPLKKLYVSCCGPATEGVLNRFLSEHFKGFKAMSVSHFIYRHGDLHVVEYEGCRLYEVFCVNDDARVKLLVEKLAEIARAVGLDCIYLKMGEVSCLIRPQPVLTERVA